MVRNVNKQKDASSFDEGDCYIKINAYIFISMGNHRREEGPRHITRNKI